ncbi:hypothetical protein ACOCEA_12645 [Maribacter sp. CXY002]|uniref:hypothetical protein n=1 Tax=Maribacter luteocoastalis TaxID=3407671 RepID=UPI003B66B738
MNFAFMVIRYISRGIMKYVFITLFLAIGTMGQAQEIENVAKHVGAGAVIGGVGGYAAHKIFKGQRGWTWAGAIGSSLAAGLAKETYDKSTAGVWQTDDVLYTTLGGIISGLAMELLFNKNNRSGKGGLRKNCGCLVSNKNNQIFDFMPLAKANGSKNISSEIQVSYFLK